MDLMLWTVNAATRLFERSRGGFQRGLEAAGHRVLIGDRRDHNRTFDGISIVTAPSRLMHELDDDDHDPRNQTVDEYWLPIAVKCCGDPDGFEEIVQDQALWDAIRRHYRHQLDDWRSYWCDSAFDRRVQMGTHEGTGLYEILVRESEAHVARTNRPLRHVLIGMSEGGVVARYLGFLDEHVCNLGLVAGVITINAPHAGSVFASARNEANVSRALFAGLLALGFDDDVFARMFTAARQTDVVSVAKLREVFAAGLEDAQRLSAPARKRHAAAVGMVETVCRWASGLDGDPRYAFVDLDAGTLDDAGSVLGSMAANPTRRIVHGALLGINDSVADFLLDVAKTPPDDLEGHLKKGGLLAWFLLNFPAFEAASGTGSIEGALRAAALRFQEQFRFAIEEIPTPETTGAGFRAARKNIEEGLDATSWDLRGASVTSRRHDFIIPAASQAWPPPRGRMRRAELFLGNHVNKAANHVSASSPHHEAGRENLRTIEGMLREMGELLAG